jgi:hypothetical protein
MVFPLLVDTFEAGRSKPVKLDRRLQALNSVRETQKSCSWAGALPRALTGDGPEGCQMQ